MENPAIPSILVSDTSPVKGANSSGTPSNTFAEAPQPSSPSSALLRRKCQEAPSIVPRDPVELSNACRAFYQSRMEVLAIRRRHRVDESDCREGNTDLQGKRDFAESNTLSESEDAICNHSNIETSKPIRLSCGDTNRIAQNINGDVFSGSSDDSLPGCFAEEENSNSERECLGVHNNYSSTHGHTFENDSTVELSYSYDDKQNVHESELRDTNNAKKSSMDFTIGRLRQELVSLMDLDLGLMKQLLTLNEAIEELKSRRRRTWADNSNYSSPEGSAWDMMQSTTSLSGRTDVQPALKFSTPSSLSLQLEQESVRLSFYDDEDKNNTFNRSQRSQYNKQRQLYQQQTQQQQQQHQHVALRKRQSLQKSHHQTHQHQRNSHGILKTNVVKQGAKGVRISAGETCSSGRDKGQGPAKDTLSDPIVISPVRPPNQPDTGERSQSRAPVLVYTGGAKDAVVKHKTKACPSPTSPKQHGGVVFPVPAPKPKHVNAVERAKRNRPAVPPKNPMLSQSSFIKPASNSHTKSVSRDRTHEQHAPKVCLIFAKNAALKTTKSNPEVHSSDTSGNHGSHGKRKNCVNSRSLKTDVGSPTGHGSTCHSKGLVDSPKGETESHDSGINDVFN